MGDSDEEYDRRKVGRDKFRRERSDYEMRGSSGGGTASNITRRDPYEERSSSRASEYGNQGGVGNAGFKKYGTSGSYNERRPPANAGNPGYGEPPMKRSRREWNDGNGGYVEGGKASQSGSRNRDREGGSDGDSRPRVMLSFKQFLYQQDDNITDEDAMQKYKEYKEEFARQQLLDFFTSHKEEEWFKEKYHPDFCEKKSVQHRENVLRRKNVFMELMNKGWIDQREVHVKETNSLVRLMNAVVIKLEDGSDEDLRILDMADADITYASLASSAAAAALAAPTTSSAGVREKDDQKGNDVEAADQSRPDNRPPNSKSKDGREDRKTDKKSRRKNIPKARKGRNSESKYSDDDDDTGSASDSDSGSESDDSFDRSSHGSSSSDEESGDETFESRSKRRKRRSNDKSDTGEERKEQIMDADDEPDHQDDMKIRERKESHKSSDGSIDSAVATKTKPESGEFEEPVGFETENQNVAKEDPEEIEEDIKDAERKMENSGTEAGEMVDDNDDEMEEDNCSMNKAIPSETTASITTSIQKMPRPLHKTHSIFLRNLHPSITRQEIEGLCKAYPGFKRLALQDPAPERKFFRRGWVTFDRSVNIKEICWNLNNIRLKDCDLGAIVNRELTQRVRPVMVLANHKPIMRQDVKFAAKIVQKLDQKHRLWSNESSNDKSVITPPSTAGVDISNQCSFNLLISSNPLMKNITEYLVDEGSYEEEALLGVGPEENMGDDNSEGENKVIDKIEEDKELTLVLDRLVLYLRIVHSVDYYSCTEYPNEDEMPHRCGIIHARGAHIQPEKALMQRDVEDYMKHFETKAAHLVDGADILNDDCTKKLGVRDTETAVEDFITSNTQELAKDKWLCPLSGKKFKGPEFVRKHILNKHGERLDEVKANTAYFNNYLRDPKRPQLPEMRPASSRDDRSNPGNLGGSTGNLRSPTSGVHDRPTAGGDYAPRSQSGNYRGRSPNDRGMPASNASDYYNASEYSDYRGYGQVLDFYGAARDFRNAPPHPPPPHGYGSRDYYSAGRVPYAQYNYRRQQQYYETMRRQAGGGYGQRPQTFAGRRLMNYKDLDAPEETY